MTGRKNAQKIIIIINFFLLMSVSAFAFVTPSDTIRSRENNSELLSDSISGKVIDIQSISIHSPRKAAMYSAILPGLGQVYNRKWWKIPIVYGGFATLGYFIKWNNGEYTIAKNAYKDLTDNDATTDSYMDLKQIRYYNLDSPSDVANLKKGLISSQDYYRRNRDLLIIVTLAFYGLNIIDASVDGHFFNFDISDDLTMKVKPSLLREKHQNILCLNCSFNF